MKSYTAKAIKTLTSQKAAGLHRLVQYAMLVFFIYVAVVFFFYFQYITGASDVQVVKPAAVEAFLPLSAFIALKRLIFTGQYDLIHPAGLTILMMAIALSLLLRRAFCGYLCPLGAVSGLLHRLGLRLGISVRPWKWLSLLLSLPKYYLLGRILLMFGGMSVNDIGVFLRSPYNMVADSKMLLFMRDLSPTMFLVLAALIIGSAIIPGFWCRGFCPYGAFTGLFSMFSPLAVRRDAKSCISCKRCAKACPSHIPVHEKTRISGPECVGCAECTSACPVEGCLSMRLGYTKKAAALPWWGICAATLSLFLGIYLWAKLTGHWDSSMPESMLRMMHMRVLQQ
ncbi:4Fe-4S binding protein [Desulfovibrio sp. OttesenSCG-928-G15]|nr:4Fe-4S binding protein [Desulfovibrio sp. OttesenSCG-928-G15]